MRYALEGQVAGQWVEIDSPPWSDYLLEAYENMPPSLQTIFRVVKIEETRSVVKSG